MWHMPGHIYSRLKRYDDAVWQQEASARADHAHMMRDRVLPDQIHNYAHNNEWLIRNLVHLGRAQDALSLAKNMLELPRHPKYNSFDKEGMCSCKYGRRRLLQVLETFNMWDELVALSETMYVEPTIDREEQGKRLRLLGVAHYHRGEGSELRGRIDALEQLIAQVDRDSDKAGEEAAKKAQADKADEKNTDEKNTDEKNADEKNDKDVKAAREKAIQRAKRGRKSLVHAVAELKGLQFLARGETDLAKEQFEAASDIPKQRLIRYCFLTGDHARAEKLASESVGRSENQVSPLAVQVDLLRRIGKRDDAEEAFKALRKIAGSADMDSPILKKLSGFAQDLDWPADWRIAPVKRDDIGQRPDPDTLGPLRWGPSPALPWSLTDSTGDEHSLASYHGRPVVVIFYLGFGCLHCVEQLHTFAPRVKDFEAAGLSLVAISTESKDDMAKALENFSPDGTFPIPLIPNQRLDVFKAYRVFDDFEEMPLHGTFLIDGQGMVRWHDISYEPFLKVDFLLNEAKRLLTLTEEGAKLANEPALDSPSDS
jgi:peroxiredoxin